MKKEFSTIPTKLLQNPDISSRAKVIYALLSDGGDLDDNIIKMKETAVKIGKAVKELEKASYLIRLPEIDPISKQYVGSFFILTEGQK